MKKKITVLTLCAMLFALCSFVEAQQTARIPKIGYLGAGFDTSGPNESFQREFTNSGMSRVKTSLSSLDSLKTIRPAPRPGANWSVSRLM